MLTLFEVYQTIETLSIPRNIHLKLRPPQDRIVYKSTNICKISMFKYFLLI